jgi:hypothetical protein
LMNLIEVLVKLLCANWSFIRGHLPRNFLFKQTFLISQVDILVPILSRFFFCWKILQDSFLSGSSGKSLSIDNRTREGFLTELQVGHLSFFLISFYIHVRVYIYRLHPHIRSFLGRH